MPYKDPEKQNAWHRAFNAARGGQDKAYHRIYAMHHNHRNRRAKLEAKYEEDRIARREGLFALDAAGVRTPRSQGQ